MSAPNPIGSNTPAPGQRNTVMLVLSYFGILALIPFFTQKDDPEVQWHARNGLALAAVEVGFSIVANILIRVLASIVGALAGLLGLLVGLVNLGFLVVAILAILKALKGERMRIPVVTDLAEKF